MTGTPPENRSILLVLDVPAGELSRARRILRRWLERFPGRKEPLRVLSFVEDPQGLLCSDIREVWGGPVERLSGKEALAASAEGFRDQACAFSSHLRTHLEELALQTGGPTWAARFGRMWWYTRLSEKNSDADAPWWSWARLEAARPLIDPDAVSRCLFLGEPLLGDLLSQLCSQKAIRWDAVSLGEKRALLPRLLAQRLLGGLYFAAAVLLARAIYKRRPAPSGERIVLAFSWVEFWVSRFGGWMDRYYGDTSAWGAQIPGPEATYALSVYGLPYIPLRQVFSRLLDLRRNRWRHVRWIVLEAEGSPFHPLRETLRVSDLTHCHAMARSEAYHRALSWGGLDLSRLFTPTLLRSVYVVWPHAAAQEKLASAATKRLKPRAALVYSFEYILGRALIRGSRNSGCRVVAMQHGPMSPMKFTYAGKEDELRPSPLGAQAYPQADLYCVDGAMGRRIWSARGIDGSKILVTGAARLDPAWERARKASRVAPGAAASRVLVATGLHDGEFVSHFAKAALVGDPRFQVVLRPHPKIRVDGLPPAIEIAASGEIYGLFESAHIFVGTYSSTCIEAIAFGLPVILLVSERVPDLSPFALHPGSVLSAATASELKAHVEALAGDDAFRKRYAARLRRVAEDVFDNLENAAGPRLAAACSRPADAKQGALLHA